MNRNIMDKIAQGSEHNPIYFMIFQAFWIAVQITLILWFGQKGYMFFYQGF